MKSNEGLTPLSPPAVLLSPLPESLTQTRRSQGRTIPMPTARSQLLLWVLHHPLQRSEDLQLALGQSAASLHRMLTIAQAGGEIEFIQQTSRWYYLSNQGLLAAAQQEHAEVKGLARLWEADERGVLGLLPRLPQLTVMQDVVNGLARHAPRMLAYTNGTLADIEWSWRRDLSHRFLTHAQEASYQVDAALCFYRYPPPEQRPSEHEGTFFALFLLLHRTTDTDHAIRERLIALLRYRESRQAFYPAFPLLLVVTQTVRQRDRWHRLAREAAQTLRLQTPLVGAITHLNLQEGGHASSWPLPWQRLGERHPCHLQNLLVPLPLAAVPPDLLIPRVDLGRPRIQKRRVLLGTFQQRATTLDTTQETGEEWLALFAGIVLRPRYLDLLRQVYLAPLLSARDLGDLMELPDPNRLTMLRYLQHLQRWGCIQRQNSASGVRWFLTRRGVQILAAIDQTEARLLIDPEKDQQRGLAHQLTFLEHTAGVYRCLAAFGQAAHHMMHHHLQWWETGTRCEDHFFSGGHWRAFRPDALFAYAIGPSLHLAWLEYDRHTESREALATKFQTYERVIVSQQWRTAWLSRLPSLLIVVPDPARRLAIGQVVRETILPGPLRVRVTTMAQLQNQGPHAAIWQQILPASGPDRRFGAFEDAEERR